MRIRDIILEDRRDFLRTQFEKKLEPLLNNVPSAVAQQVGELTPENLFNWIVAQDPTKNFKYSTWLLNVVTKGASHLEDLLYAREILTAFTNKQRELERKDIGQYSSLSDVSSAVQNKNLDSQQVTQAEEQQARRESDKLYEDDTWLVVVPKTTFAAQYWGRDSEWCTAYGYAKGRYPERSHNQFEYYSNQDPIYTLVYKSDLNKSLQFHFVTNQIFDTNQDTVDLKPLVDAYPKMFDRIADYHFNNSDNIYDFIKKFVGSKLNLSRFEDTLLQKNDQKALMLYALEFKKEEWPEFEDYILDHDRDFEDLLDYVTVTRKQSWPRLEDELVETDDVAAAVRYMNAMGKRSLNSLAEKFKENDDLLKVVDETIEHPDGDYSADIEEYIDKTATGSDYNFYKSVNYLKLKGMHSWPWMEKYIIKNNLKRLGEWYSYYLRPSFRSELENLESN